ncbi:MAG: hypothetical protein V3S51_08580 [Dehalococcoidia bacterium]
MALEIPEDIKGLVYSVWLPRITSTVLEGVKELPVEQRDHILGKMCKTCEDLAMAGAVGIQPGMNWEAYQEFVKGLPPPMGPWTIERAGDVFDLVYGASVGEDGKPQCHCPLVQLGISEPSPECCSGGAGLAANMIEAATNRAVAKAEVIASPLRTGDPVCHYRVHLKP